MKVLILGGGGFVGRAVTKQLMHSDWATPIVASRSASNEAKDGIVHRHADSQDAASLREALQGVDAVVNCVTGNSAAISNGARLLCEVAADTGRPHLVHMSTMSVYGSSIGKVAEEHPLLNDLGWYGSAKIAAEGHVQSYTESGGTAAILRPGCVIGPGSYLWSERISAWLRYGWLGDLGEAGDGWSNLVHVNDLATATLSVLKTPASAGEPPATYNVVAPDSPRWNRYFIDLAMQLNATPVRRISARQLRWTSRVLGVPLKMLERLGVGQKYLPPGIPPSLLSLWRQDILLDSEKLRNHFDFRWTAYPAALATSVA